MNTREKRGQILRQLREKRNIRQKDIADYLEITQQAYQRYEAGTSEPSGDLLCKLADFYHVTTDCLLGREPMTNPLDSLNTVESPDVSEKEMLETYFSLEPKKRAEFLKVLIKVVQEGKQRKEQLSASQIRYIYLQCLEDAASAGTGEYLQSSNTETIKIVETPESLRADFVVRISGDSMEPTYHDGDWVLVEACDELQEGDIGIFRNEGQGYIKEYGKDGLISHNPDYPIIPRSKLTECRISGKVIGVADLAE